MKSFITPAYVFTPGLSGVGKVNLSGIVDFNIKYLVSVINQTRGAVIYSTASADNKYTAISGTELTLNCDTSAHSSDDILQVLYESPIDSIKNGSNLNSQLVALGATSFDFSSVNSSTAQLAAGATFPGAIETIVNQQAISVLVTCDQPATLVLNQYIDQAGTRLIASWTYNLSASVPFSRSFTANGNYFNLTLTNNGAATTTTLNINAAFGTLSNSTNLGNTAISLNEVNGAAITTGVPIKGAIDAFKDGFKAIDASKWVANIHAANADQTDGTVAGSGYRKLILSATTPDTQSYIYSKTSFKMPARIVFGGSISQRVLGEELYFEIVDTDNLGVPTVGTPDAPMAITSIRVLSNVAYITFASSIAGKLFSLDRICIYGCADPLLNVGPVLVTTIWPSQNIALVPLTKSDGTYAVTGANVLRLDPLLQAANGMAFLWDGTNTSNAIPVTKNDGGAPLFGASSGYATTNSIQASAQPFGYSFQAPSVFELLLKNDEAKWVSQAIDGTAAPTISKRSQSIPAPDKNYVVRLRQRNLPNKSVPIGKIVSITKSGSTAATVVLDAAPTMPLVAGDIFCIVGSNDQTANVSSTTTAVITSVTNPTTFVMTWGASATTVSWGGVVIRQNGPNTATAAQGSCIRGIARSTNGYMMVATQAGSSLLVGDTISIQGVRSNVADIGIDGRYKIAMLTPNFIYGNTNTSAVVTGIADTSLIAVGALVSGSGVAASSYVVSVQPGVGFTLNAATSTSVTNTPFTFTGFLVEATGAALQPTGGTQTALIGTLGGAYFKETEFRLNFIKCLDYNRTPVEVIGGQNTNDSFSSTSVVLAPSTLTTVTSVTTLTSISQIAALPANTVIYDLQHMSSIQAHSGAVK